MIKSKEYYLNTFKVDEDLLYSLCAEALHDGGDFSDLYFENTGYYNLMLRDSEVSVGGFHIDYGVGIRVLSGEKTGYAYCETTERSAMTGAAKAAAAIAANASPSDNCSPRYTRHYVGRPNPSADRYPIVNDWCNADLAAYVPYLEELDRKVRAKDPRVTNLIAGISGRVSDILMFNSLGEIKYETRPTTNLTLSAIVRQGDRIERQNASRSFMMGAEMLTPELMDEMVAKVLDRVDERFEAKRPKGGEMNVVMGAGASGILLHEAMGHAFEADFNRKGQSVFSDKMGQRICSRGINIVDDGTIPFNRGSINFDDEGVPGQKTYMVEDGVLTSYLHDRISASYYGVAPTGNGRRESFRYMPIPRMRATYMDSGTAKADDIIASVKKGIYVDEFGNGEVQIGEGDFTFYVRSGYLIENGRLTAPVKDINIIGNGPQALADIEMVADDLKIDNGTWTCGKEQSVQVTCGIPTVLIKKLIVGGE